MHLVVDTNVLVGEVFRETGRYRLTSHHVDLFLPQRTRDETYHELPRRLAAVASHRGMSDDDARAFESFCVDTIEESVAVVPEAVYSPYGEEARLRSVRDPDDWPQVACALALNAGIWTQDNDLFGTGVATWTIETLTTWLDRQPGISITPVRHLAVRHGTSAVSPE